MIQSVIISNIKEKGFQQDAQKGIFAVIHKRNAYISTFY